MKIQPQKKNLEPISCPSFKFTVVDGMGEEDTKQKTRALKLRLRPTKEQKTKFDQWAGCYRFLYNKTIGLLTNKKNKTVRKYNVLRYRLTTIKNQKTKKINSFFSNKKWLESCPTAIRKYAIKEATSNLQSCFTNLKNKNIKSFSAPFKTKKKEIQKGYSFPLEKTTIKKDKNKLLIYSEEYRYYGTKQLHKLIKKDQPDMDCRIQKSAYNEYFLIVYYTVKQRTPVKKEFINPVSIDPGIRKFITTYSMQESYMIGNRWSHKIMEVLLKLDKEKDPKKQKKYRKRVMYLKKELHYQTANLLSKKYDLLLMPKLDTKKLSEKYSIRNNKKFYSRRLKTKTVREMMNAGHCKFFDRLKDKAWEHGCKFLEVKEHYTSQTCPYCGTLNKCNETYKCKNCKFCHDRDMVGALNIMLKAVRS